MKEEFLHYVWKYQLLNISSLETTQKETLSVLFPGIHNHDSGPDFLNAQIRIEDQLWAGNVEIHLKSSDWYWHQHEIDENYDAVILHVVWDDDVQVFMKNNVPIPTLELKKVVQKDIYKNYQKLTKVSIDHIPCEQQISEVSSFVITNWMERLYIERLERKAILIQSLLQQTQNDWDAVLFILLAKNFGLNKNGDAFFQLAESIPFSVLRKVGQDEYPLNALLFGQAGFLEKELETEYGKNLKKEYGYLQKKFDLQSMNSNLFHFFRMRPSNFPTIRLAQFAEVYTRSFQLFTELMECQSADEVYDLFNVELNDFWKTHYTLSKESKRSHKKLTKSFIDLLIINTIVPLKFCYQQVINQTNAEQLITFLESLQPEKNSAIDIFETLGLKVQNAFQSQALLELKKNYCNQKRCLECAIGNEILKR
jgi:hypothetical protein